jgi:hypothetical protein
MNDNLDDFIEWLRVLKLPEEDFRRHIRGYFDDTGQMERYIASRQPQAIRYAHLTDSEIVAMSAVPTKPAPVLFDDPEHEHKGRYKGKRRKR